MQTWGCIHKTSSVHKINFFIGSMSLKIDQYVSDNWRERYGYIKTQPQIGPTFCKTSVWIWKGNVYTDSNVTQATVTQRESNATPPGYWSHVPFYLQGHVSIVRYWKHQIWNDDRPRSWGKQHSVCSILVKKNILLLRDGLKSYPVFPCLCSHF